MAAHCFDQYRGELDARQIAAGMNAAEQNAARLLADAELLLAAARYPTAASVAILSIEEARKVSILRRMATCRDDAERQQVWSEYRSDRSRNRHSVMPSVCAEGHLEDLRRAVNAPAEPLATIVILKHLGFHTDCLGHVDWSEPQSAVGQHIAEQFVGIARLAAAGSGERHTAKEIELWSAHIGPVKDKPVEWLKTALRNWHRAMAEHGLPSL
jgi:AbiV family abortive infection protein